MPEKRQARGTNEERRTAREKVEKWTGSRSFFILRAKGNHFKVYLKQQRKEMMKLHFLKNYSGCCMKNLLSNDKNKSEG